VILTTTAALKMQQNQWCSTDKGALDAGAAQLNTPNDLRDSEAVSLHLPDVLDQLLS
jgi:hypothetical protein